MGRLTLEVAVQRGVHVSLPSDYCWKGRGRHDSGATNANAAGRHYCKRLHTAYSSMTATIAKSEVTFAMYQFTKLFPIADLKREMDCTDCSGG